MSTVMSFCNAGDHILVSRSIFGATVSLFDKYFKRFGIEVTYVAIDQPAAWTAACQPNTKLFFLESPSNPLAELADIRVLADIAFFFSSRRRHTRWTGDWSSDVCSSD